MCGVASVLPPEHGYREPMSLQIARGEKLAWVVFCFAGCAVLAAVPTLVRVGRYFSGVFCGLVVLGLWVLATTNPASKVHLTVFIYLAAAILGWLWALWASLLDGRLLVYASVATLGALGCILSFGVGERVMILSSLAGLNTLLLTDLLD